jgi:hypothetical protein
MRRLALARIAMQRLAFAGAAALANTATLSPASWIGSDWVAGFRSARDGAPGSTYYGAYLIVGDADYVWWSHVDEDGVTVGHDPGLDVAELAGLTGHEVALAAGNRTGAQVATATATVIDAIAAYGCTADGADITVTGTATLSTGTAFASRGAAGYFGSAAERATGLTADGGSWYSGGLNGNTYATAFTTSAGDKRLVAIDIRLGTTVSAAIRPRASIWVVPVSDTDMTGATLVHDFGQIPAAAIVANTWVRLWVPPDVAAAMAGSTRHALAIKASTTATHVNFENPAASPNYEGDFATTLVRGDGSMSGDETTAFPATWQGGSEAEGSFPFVARVIYDEAPYRGSASFARVWGVHVDAGTLPNEIDLNSMVGCGAASPAILGAEIDYLEIAIGTHPVGEQFRCAVSQGGSNADPSLPDPDGASVIWDAGQTTGTGTGWQRITAPTGGSAIPLAASTLTWILFRSDNDATGITIAFSLEPNWDFSDPEDSPMDFVRPLIAGGDPADGPEFEWFPVDPPNDDHATNPATPYEAALVGSGGDMTYARPGNLPGVRLGIRVPGISVAA